MFLTSIDKRRRSHATELADSPAAGKLLRAWHEFSSAIEGFGADKCNVVVLSGSSLGADEVVLDQLCAAVEQNRTFVFDIECFAEGDWNLGVFERLILQERKLFATGAELRAVVDRYQHVLRIISPALFTDHDENAVKSLLFDHLQGRNHGIIETFGFVESLLDELACFLSELLTVLHERHSRLPVLCVRNLQWIDSYSFNVLAALIARLKHKPAFICLSTVADAAPDWLRRRMKQLISDLGLTLLEVDAAFAADSSTEAHSVSRQQEVERVVSELDEPVRNYCKLISFANWNLTAAELELAYRVIWGEPAGFSAARILDLDPAKPGERRITISPVWRQAVQRLAGVEKTQIHRALADAALQSSGNAGTATIPAHVTYQLLESSQLIAVAENAFALGFHLFEKVGDVDGAICFYRRILSLGSHALPQPGRLLAKLANLYFSKGQVTEASAYYDQAIAHETDAFHLALLHYQHSLLFCKKLSSFDRAADLLNAGLAAAESISDADERRYITARLYNAEALIHYRRGRPDKAMASLKDADSLLRDISIRSDLASYRFFVSKNQAQVHDRCFHDFEQAVSQYQNCLSIARAFQQKYNEVLALLLLGRTYAGHSELAQANECFDEALTLAADKTQFLPVAQLHQFVIRVFTQLKLDDPALFWIDKLAAFYSSQHRIYDAITYLQQKAKQYYDAQLYDEAKWCFESSTSLLDKHIDGSTSWPQLSLNAHVYLGFIYQLKQDLTLAQSHLREALAVVSSAEQQGGGKRLRGPTERLASVLESRLIGAG